MRSSCSGSDQLLARRVDAQGAQPVELAVDDRDVVAQLDQLRLGEVGMEALPKVVVGEPWVPGDRLGPIERRALALVVGAWLVKAGQLLVLGEEASAQLL